MDRLEAAKYIKAHCLGSEVCRDGTRWNDAMMTAVEALEGKDTNVTTKWIPVSERLPEEGHDVLITKESFKIKGYEQNVIKAKRSVDPRSGKIEWWSEFGALKDKAVLAWMPLPEPYKEGE